MPEPGPFDVERLFADPGYAPLAVAAVAAASLGIAAPFVAAVRERPDESLAAFVASTQGIAGLLSRLPGSGELPPGLLSFLRADGERTRARWDALAARLGEVLSALRPGGIDPVVLKGAALVLGGDVPPGERPMGDLDLLLDSPRDLERATELLLAATPFRPLLDTPRHRVFVLADERVVLPAADHPGNPIRVELHTRFRLPVLGTRLDATRELVSTAREVERDGLRARVPSPAARVRHLLHHAAEDFGARGIKGVQALDLALLARRDGPLAPALPPADLRAAAPLLYAADAIERLFPGTFAPAFCEELAARVPPRARERAASLPPLRHTRPPHGFTRVALGLCAGGRAKGRFLLRTLFPAPGEVRVNVAPDASGAALAAAYAKVLVSRVRAVRRGAGPRSG